MKRLLYAVILGALALQYCVLITPVSYAPPTMPRSTSVGVSGIRTRYTVTTTTCAGDTVTEEHELTNLRGDVQVQSEGMLAGVGLLSATERNRTTGELISSSTILNLYGGVYFIPGSRRARIRPFSRFLASVLFGSGPDGTNLVPFLDPKVGVLFREKAWELAVSTSPFYSLEASFYLMTPSLREKDSTGIGFSLHTGFIWGSQTPFVSLGMFTRF